MKVWIRNLFIRLKERPGSVRFRSAFVSFRFMQLTKITISLSMEFTNLFFLFSLDLFYLFQTYLTNVVSLSYYFPPSFFDICLSIVDLIICFSAVDLMQQGQRHKNRIRGYASIPSPEGGGAAVMCLWLWWAQAEKGDWRGRLQSTLSTSKRGRGICDVVRWRRDRWCWAAGGDALISWMITAMLSHPLQMSEAYYKTVLTDRSITDWNTQLPVCDI